MIWLFFFAIAAVLVYASSKLTVYADALAEEFGLARSWMGLLVVGLVTSLPELATTLSSIVKVNAPNMALGNIFGSVMFNLLILVVTDIVFRKGGLLRFMDRENIWSAGFDIAVLVLMLAGMLLPIHGRLGSVSFCWGSPAVLVVGMFAFWLTYKLQHGPVEGEGVLAEAELPGKKKVVLPSFLFSAAGVVVCGYALAVTGDKLAASTGMSHNFVGSLFLAIATSLPELIVSFTAIRMGAYELMLGNVLGSNIWNVMIVACADFAYTREGLAIPGNLGWDQVYSGGIGILTTMVVIGFLLRKKPEKSRFAVGYESLVILALYVLCLGGLYFWGGAL